MNNHQKIAILLLTVALPFVLCGEEVVEAIVAVVNDDIISLSDYKKQHDALYQTLQAQIKNEAEFRKTYEQLRMRLLDTMITNILLLQEAREMGLDVQEQIRQYIEQIKKRNGFETDEQLRRAIEQQGTTYEAFRDNLEESYLRESIIYMKVGSSIRISDSDVVSYYKAHPEEFTELPEYSLRAIYIAVFNHTAEEIEAKKAEIDQKLKGGEDFGAVAAEFSEGAGKENQGDLGTFKKGDLDKTLEQAVEGLNVGDVSSWVEIKNGWYLLKLEDKKESRLKSFDEVRDGIERKLFEEQQQEKLDEYLEEIRKRSYIKILMPNPLDF